MICFLRDAATSFLTTQTNKCSCTLATYAAVHSEEIQVKITIKVGCFFFFLLNTVHQNFSKLSASGQVLQRHIKDYFAVALCAIKK